MTAPSGTLASYPSPQEGIDRMRARSLAYEADRAALGRHDNRRMVCQDCNCLDEGYMVEDDVWAQAHPDGRKGLLCLHCISSRLGRPLTAADFTNALINLPILYGIRIGAAGAPKC